MLAWADLEQSRLDRNVDGHVERRRREREDLSLNVGGRGRNRHQVRHRLSGVENGLLRSVRGVGIDGAQRLVPVDHIHDGDLQCRDIQVAGQLQRERNVVCGGVDVEPVEEPHALLRKRQRDALRPDRRDQCSPAALPRRLFDAHREQCNRRRLEQHAHRHGGVECHSEPRDHLGGDQRVTAELEEVVVQSYPLDAENLGEDVGDDLFDRCRRCAEISHLEHRRRQCAPVQLSVDRQRNRLQRNECRRNHVLRQQFGDTGSQILEVEGRPTVRHRRDHVGDQPGRPGRILTDDDGGLGDGGVRGDRGLDLAQLDSEAAHLDLIVGAAQIFELARRVPLRQIAGAIQQRPGIGAGGERIGHEPHRGERRASQVSARQLSTGNVHLAGHPDRDRMEPGIENVDAQPSDRLADHRCGRCDGRGAQRLIRHVHRGLGDAVHVDQLRCTIAVPLEPAAQSTLFEGLAAEDHVAQRQLAAGRGRRAIGLGQLVERRRSLVEHRHPFVHEQLMERFG
nr:hypothetical protein [Rhodococcus fascians]